MARLSGDASLNYTSYEGSARNAGRSGRNSMSSTSLVQNYSLIYSSSGDVYNSRFGYYDVSLGYNWNALDTTFKSSTQTAKKFSETRGHILYKGEVYISPKEIPLTLKAYSFDLNRNSVSNSSGGFTPNFETIIDGREQATSINNGLHIQSGVTMVAGVKNGMTNGYNEILRHFPMILLDYKDTINRDLASLAPYDNRLSRLAFVSLNKKDNWFHYRHTLYEDYIDSSYDYTDSEIQLGTVDQTMARRWVDFSNWLKVSTDLQLSRHKLAKQVNTADEISLNFFVTAERSRWRARTFTSFDRYMDESKNLTYRTVLPLYASGQAGRDISWNARTSFRSNNDIKPSGISTKYTSFLAGYRVDALKSASFTLSQSFEVESSNENSIDLLTLSGGLETTSTSRFSRDVSLAASYNVKNATTSSPGSTSNLLNQTLNLNAAYTLTSKLRINARQMNVLNSAIVGDSSGTNTITNAQTNQYLNPNSSSISDGSEKSYSSVSSVAVIWNPKPRMNVDFNITEDYYKSGASGVSSVTGFKTSISYSNSSWTLKDTLNYTHGDRGVDNNANSFSNSASLRYIHSRSLDTSASASYKADISKGITTYSSDFGQQLNYSLFTSTGVARKILEFNETIAYSDGSSNLLSSRQFNKSLTLGLRYYPISRLTLGAGAGYSYTTSINDYSFVWNASATANFSLLQASVDYTNGIRKSDGARESRLIGNIRKAF